MNSEQNGTAETILSSPTFGVVGSLNEFNGYVMGCRSPSLVGVLDVGKISTSTRQSLVRLFKKLCPAMKLDADSAFEGELDIRKGVEWLLVVWKSVQKSQGLVTSEPGKVLSSTSVGVRCIIPVVHQGHKAVSQLIVATLNWIKAHEVVTQNKDKSVDVAVDNAMSTAVKALALLAPKGSNIPRFLNAAYELGMPVMVLPGGVIQYGVGSRARWLDSSFTDETSNISSKLARNKYWASSLLAQAGIPVAPQIMVSDADQAANVAEKLGYPVVVKPANLDGGVGVAAGLDSEKEVRDAFLAAKKHSGQILIEKHVHGRDYRLTVFRDEMIWAIERVPAGLWGDGKLTVEELLEQANEDPRRGSGPHAELKKLVFDEESTALLKKQGLEIKAVPKAGQFVRLRRAANVATGGQPIAVTHKVHPDNALLALRAAQTIGLDLAGIDLLIDDISRSWRESDTPVAICEVNGQPQLGQVTASHLYSLLLQRLVKGDGRVPIILVLGAEQPEEWLEALTLAFQGVGLTAGTAGVQGVNVGVEQLTKRRVRLFDSGKMLALNRKVDAMVLAIDEDSMMLTGLPWARYDALIVAGSRWIPKSRENNLNQEQQALRWLQNLLPACDGLIIVHTSSGLRVNGVEKLTHASLTTTGANIKEAANELVGKVMLLRERDS